MVTMLISLWVCGSAAFCLALAGAAARPIPQIGGSSEVALPSKPGMAAGHAETAPSAPALQFVRS